MIRPFYCFIDIVIVDTEYIRIVHLHLKESVKCMEEGVTYQWEIGKCQSAIVIIQRSAITLP